MDVFGAEAEADDAGGDAAEDGEALEECEGEREFGDEGFEGQGWADEAFVGDDLEGLGHARWEGAAGLDFFEMGVECGEIWIEFVGGAVWRGGRRTLRSHAGGARAPAGEWSVAENQPG